MTMQGQRPAVSIVDEVTEPMRNLGTSLELAEAAFKAYSWYLDNIQYPKPSRVITLAQKAAQEEMAKQYYIKR